MELFPQQPELPQKPGYAVTAMPKGYQIAIPDGQLFYAGQFFDQSESDRIVDYFLDNTDESIIDWRAVEKENFANIVFKNIAWNHDRIHMYGREVYQPRYTAWYGDPGMQYTYSGLKLNPHPWNEGLAIIRDRVSDLAGIQFNSVLLNWYRDGDDHMGWHSDDEKELGQDPVICSVNFGATRRFQFRRRDDHAEKLECILSHGTVLIMRGRTQHFWQHAAPRQRRVKEPRFNLTFRVIKN